MYRIAVSLILSLLLLPSFAWSMHPLQTEDTATEGSGNMLLELKYDVSAKDDAKTTRAAAAFSLGMGKKTDFILEVPHLQLVPSPVTGSDASGLGDSLFKIKHQLFENEVKQSMAYELYLDLPSGELDKGLGTNNVSWGFKIMDSQECRGNAFHLNVGYETRTKDTKAYHFARNYAFTFGLAMEHEVNRSFRILGEVAGESRKESNESLETFVYKRPITFLLGIVLDITRSWYIDAGYRIGLNSHAEDHMAQVGTAWRF